MELCACGSGLPYADCCRAIIKGERRAATAVELMRARYAAYANVETDFIFDTTHPKHREGYDADGTRQWAEKSEWQGLEIVSTKDGGEDDATGEVEFIARWKEQGEDRVHHECALFKKEKDGWLFTDGKPVTRQPVVRTAPKIGRNDPCSCGSGIKYKKCCGK